jgi:hypothetical protein
MVDKIDAQSIYFPNKDGEIISPKPKNERITLEKQIMDKETENAICESTRNYNHMINNMFKVCSQMCFKTFQSSLMNESEKVCAENCQKKFYHTYAIGESFVKLVLKESNNSDFLDNKTELDFINVAQQQSQNKL